MERPKPSDQHRKLHRLAGNWEGDEVMAATEWGPGGVARGHYVMRVDIDGFFVIQDYQQELGITITHRGHGVLGWNSDERLYTWYWVDSIGQVPFPSLGVWEGDVLQFLHGSNGERRGRYTYRFLDDQTFSFHIENSKDSGQTWQTYLEAKYTKR